MALLGHPSDCATYRLANHGLPERAIYDEQEMLSIAKSVVCERPQRLGNYRPSLFAQTSGGLG